MTGKNSTGTNLQLLHANFLTEMDQRFVLSVDFEAYRFEDNSWFGFSAAICGYPMGCIVDSITRILKVPVEFYDEPRKHFWLTLHPKSHEYMYTHGEDMQKRKHFEMELVKFVRDAHRKYTALTVISDNPSFDIRLLDMLLAEYKAPASCYRADGTWHHVVDTASYQMALQDCFHTKSLLSIHRKWFTRNRLIVRQVDNVQPEHAILHTPLYDCLQVASAYFIALDLAKFRSG